MIPIFPNHNSFALSLFLYSILLSVKQVSNIREKHWHQNLKKKNGTQHFSCKISLKSLKALFVHSDDIGVLFTLKRGYKEKTVSRHPKTYIIFSFFFENSHDRARLFAQRKLRRVWTAFLQNHLKERWAEDDKHIEHCEPCNSHFIFYLFVRWDVLYFQFFDKL